MSLLTRKVPPLVAIALCAIVSWVAYPYLDRRIPVHWGASGHISSYADRHVAVFLNPTGALVAFLFFLLIPYTDKRRVGQLRRLGLYEPLRNVAVYGFAHAHLLALGIGSGLLPRDANFIGGFAGMLLALLGIEASLGESGALGFATNSAGHPRVWVWRVNLALGSVIWFLTTTGRVPDVIWGLALALDMVWTIRALRTRV